MCKTVLISVVIPMYNKVKYVKRAIQSVLNQTYTDFELIVVDDGSTDGSGDVVESIIDSRLLIISQTNKGVSAARNEGVYRAKGKWVAFLDADDEYLPMFLDKISTLLSNNITNSVVMLGTNYYIDTIKTAPAVIGIADGVYNFFQLFYDQRSPSNSSTTVINKNVFIKTGGYPNGIKQFEDWILYAKLAFVGQMYYISEPLGIYHKVLDSVSTTERDPSELFHDAILFPQTIYEGIGRGTLSMKQKQSAITCATEFSVNLSQLFCRYGAKKQSIKILKYIRCTYLSRQYWGRFLYLIGLILIPKLIRRRIRGIRGNR